MNSPTPPPPPPDDPDPPGDAARFSNDPLAVDGLPRLDDVDVTPLDPRHRTARLVGMAIAAAVVGGGTAALAVVTDAAPAVVIAGAVVVGLLAVSAVMWVLEFRRLGYVLREHDVSLRSGLISHQTATLPFTRVQHVSVTRGPLERMFGLATVSVSSAGPDISIPGLAIDDAERIKQLITERSGADDLEPTEPADGEPDPFASPPAGTPA